MNKVELPSNPLRKKRTHYKLNHMSACHEERPGDDDIDRDLEAT